MDQQGLFQVDVESFQKLIDGLDVQSCDELTGRLQEGVQQRYLDSPPEVREQVFRLIIEDYFEEFPERSVLVYQNWIMGPCTKINISGNAGLPLKDLPLFEIALIPDQKLYREFFALRIEQCTLELRPSFTWSHVYSFPPEVQVADPPEEITDTDYLHTQYIGAERWKKRSAPTFDVLSCNLKYAANLASLSYILGHKSRGSGNPFDQADTLLSTTVLPIILRSLKNTFAVEPKQSTLIPCPSIPAHNVQYQNFPNQNPPKTL
ncbi:hypothetical protein EAF00_004175 [Botryotinia globosa]|nr:hypothetical protein EAF00_004175 [Botryotinia globosa]